MAAFPQPTYPTQCLRFLDRLGRDKHSAENKAAHVRLHIIIAGAGLGGLACAIALARSGHTVQVFEQAAQFGEVGAGIQVPSNSTRLLLKWGLEPLLRDHVVEPVDISIRRWKDGSLIGLTKLRPEFRRDFGAPYYVVHRADFHAAMLKKAIELGVDVNAGAEIVHYEPEKPSIRLASGQEHAADLVIGADGLKSLARKTILGDRDKQAKPMGFAAYRGIVPADKIRNDPELASLLEQPRLHLWLGDRRHVMSYTIAGGKSFNMVLSHPETSDPGTWRQDTAIQDMRKHFADWDPRLTKIINMLEHTLKWPLLSGQRLDQWLHPSNKILILGDAAHPMLPYMSQGAAMAVEDAGALAHILSLIGSPAQLPAALKVFERVRMERTSQMQDASVINSTLWHFADGPEQEARDLSMRPEVEGKQFVESANQWSDPLTQVWCYGYDAEEVVGRAWEEYLKNQNT